MESRRTGGLRGSNGFAVKGGKGKSEGKRGIKRGQNGQMGINGVK